MAKSGKHCDKRRNCLFENVYMREKVNGSIHALTFI